MRQILPALLALICVAAFSLALWSGYRLWQLRAENGYIRAVAGGQSLPLPDQAGAYAQQARVLNLARLGRPEEAEAMLPGLVDLPAKLLADARYAIGNARLRAGYAQMDAGRSHEAVPHISLAKNAYREALKILPGDHDTRLNLALAMRLVRDLPRPLQSPSEDEDAAPRQLWTDLPGLPRGAP